jgi:ABC-2 type transport system permease protein
VPRARVFTKVLRDVRWQIFWYGVGLASMAALIVYIWPSYSDQLGDLELPEAFQAFFGEIDFATPEGFLGLEFFGWVPALIAVFAIMRGTNTIAGEEVSGTMDILLAQPIRRSRLVIEMTASFVVATFLILTLTSVGWLVSVPFVAEMDIPIGRVLFATYSMAAFGLGFFAFSLWLSVALPTRASATAIAAMVAVFGYFANTLGGAVELLQPLRWASPFFYYDGQALIAGDAGMWKLGVLLGSWALFTGLALIFFERREIGVRQVETSIFQLPFRRRPV